MTMTTLPPAGQATTVLYDAAGQPVQVVAGQPQAHGAACPRCGEVGTLRPHERKMTRKRRAKFGLFWLAFTVLTGGFGFLLYLVWPRHEETIGVDRYMKCHACKSRI